MLITKLSNYWLIINTNKINIAGGNIELKQQEIYY